MAKLFRVLSDYATVTTAPRNAFRVLATGTKSRFQRWRVTRATHTLEKELAAIVRVANGHKAKKLAPGAEAYCALYRQATLKIDQFVQIHQVDRQEIETQIPVLRDLEALTHPPSPKAVVGNGLAIVAGLLLGAFLLGCASGVMAWGYHLMARLL